MAAVAWGVTQLGGEALVALRLPNVLAGAGTALVTASLARRLGASGGAATVAALAVGWAPYYAFTFHHLNMNGFEVLLFAVFTRLALQAVEESAPRVWLGCGAALGLGMLAKYGIGLYAAAVAIGVVATSARRVPTSRGPWLAASVALALLSPHLVWQVQHGFPTLEFIQNARTDASVPNTGCRRRARGTIPTTCGGLDCGRAVW